MPVFLDTVNPVPNVVIVKQWHLEGSLYSDLVMAHRPLLPKVK